MIARDTAKEKTASGVDQIGFFRLKQVLALLPVGKSTWWAGVKTGRFPQPVRMPEGRITFWRKKDILELVRKVRAGEEI